MRTFSLVLLVIARLNAQSLPGVVASDVAVDSQGFIFLAGSTTSNNLPTTAGVYQPSPASPCVAQACTHGFAAKLSPSGDTVLWATYVAGNESESIRALALSADGSIYVAGSTTSKTLSPVSASNQYGPGRLFVAKLSSDGKALLGLTYFGGSGNDGLTGVKLDAAGNVYLAGTTASADFPTTPGAYQRTLGATPSDYPNRPAECLGADQFVVKFDPALKTPLFSTLIGTPFAESADDFAIGPDNSVYVAGISGNERSCPSWPLLTRLNPQGSGIIYSVKTGGQALAVDPDGNAYAAHDTRAFSLAPPHAEIWKLNPKGAVLATTSIAGLVDSMAVANGEIGILGYSWPTLLYPTPGAPGACVVVHYETSLTPYLVRLVPTGLAYTYLGYLRSNRGGFSANKLLGPDRLVASYPYYSQLPYTILPVGLPPPGTVTCILDAADYQRPQVAPGELLSLFGTGIGAPSPALAQPDVNGTIGADLGGVRVTVNGLPAPLLYAASGQINMVMPFGVSGDTVQFEIRRDGRPIAAVSQFLIPRHPGAFNTGTQFGPLAALNQDGSVNSDSNPAAPGSVISIFATGLGAMTPQLPDGAAPAQVANTPAVKPRVTVNNQTAQVLYMGNAPTLVEGVVQINLRLPNPLPPNPYLLLYPGTATVWLDYPSEAGASTGGRVSIK